MATEINMPDPPDEAWEISRIQAKEAIDAASGFILISFHEEEDGYGARTHLSTGKDITALPMISAGMYELQSSLLDVMSSG